MEEFPLKDLTYKINGLIFEIYKEIGFGYQEKYYQRAFEVILKKNKIKYSKELHCPIYFKGKIIGRYFVDFLIEHKIVIEFKVANIVYQRHFRQVIGYLKSNKLKVGLLALITPEKVIIKRIVNSQISA